MELILLEVKANIGKWKKKMKHKMDVINGCLQSITKLYIFERPSCIILLSKGSIIPIQQNMQHIRMAHDSI